MSPVASPNIADSATRGGFRGDFPVNERAHYRLASCTADRATVPQVSRFFGIVIVMYFNDHEPAHFHAERAEYRIKVDIEHGTVEGRFPARALALVEDWRRLHVDELRTNWSRARARQPLLPIALLE